MVYGTPAGSFSQLDGEGMVMGVLKNAEYRDYERKGWQPGTVVVIGTDGITETRSPAGEFFGAERVRQILRANASASAAAIQAAVIDAVQAFRGSAPQEDDVTLVVAKLL
jgi:sigma-B regulation protein RsbU (phosphoserine phosphatase)